MRESKEIIIRGGDWVKGRPALIFIFFCNKTYLSSFFLSHFLDFFFFFDQHKVCVGPNDFLFFLIIFLLVCLGDGNSRLPELQNAL